MKGEKQIVGQAGHHAESSDQARHHGASLADLDTLAGELVHDVGVLPVEAELALPPRPAELPIVQAQVVDRIDPLMARERL